MGDRYVVKQELDIWGNEQTVARRAVSGADVVNGVAGGIAFLAARHKDAKWKTAMDKLALAEKYADAGDFDNALLVAQQVTSMGGKQYQLLGRASEATLLTHNKKNYGAAIPVWDQTIELARELDVTQIENFSYKSRGVCYYHTKQIADAWRDFAKFSQLQPEDAEGPAWLGMSLIELGDLPQAVVKLSQAISMAPGEAWLYRERAYASTEMGDKQAALADMNKAIVLAPENTRYYYRRGELQADLGNTEAAIDDYTRALQLNPGDVEVLEARARLYEQRGETERHLADTQQITKERPVQKAYELYLAAATSLYNNGHTREFAPHETQPTPNWPRITLRGCLRSRRAIILVYLRYEIETQATQIPNRPDRQAVGEAGAAAATTLSDGQTTQVHVQRASEWHAVRAERRHLVEDDAPRLTTLEERLLVLHAVA